MSSAAFAKGCPCAACRLVPQCRAAEHVLRCLLVTDERLVVDGYYRGPRGFTFFVDSRVPDWRSPQRGAIGELFSHWSLPRQPPALISLPTGAGKTAVALTAPHLIEARRVLVVVPGRDLRRQTVNAFGSQAVLRHIGALTGPGDPRAVELSGLVDDWSVIRGADVVVALPNSISPAYYSQSAVPPPQDLFDLIVVDLCRAWNYADMLQCPPAGALTAAGFWIWWPTTGSA